ncbi:hypothetical protein BDZ45DRAFT_753852 [Acephala macrosclerotiorum]|nr:hypothetical protein BDZ45DRAFT_753852 [Acephala macrosclerotiorum]
MDPILVSFIICLSSGLPPTVVLIYKHSALGKTDYLWERVVIVLFDVCQAGLSICWHIAIAFGTNTEPYWLEAVILYTFQISVGANLARTLYLLSHPRWTIWLAYAITILTAPDIVYRIKDKNPCFVYESALLARVATASLIFPFHELRLEI